MKRAALIFLSIWLVASCDVPVRQCEDQTDCFGGEVCRSGECIPGSLNAGDGGDLTDARAPNFDAGPDLQPGDCRLGEDPCGNLVCNVSTGACEPCQRDLQCDRGEICERTQGVCVCDNVHHLCGTECVPDDSPQSCGSRCDPCPDAEDGMAACISGECGIECDPDFRPCDGCAFARQCIQCEQPSECQDYDASRCAEGVCAGCEGDSDCNHMDRNICVDGVCVECDTGKSDACGSYSCDPATNACTNTRLSSREWCESCVADSECEPNHRCISMNFAGNARPNGYCLVEANETCFLPHPIVVQRDSLSGVKGEFYCSIREDLTTCEAVKSFGNNCDQDDDCGAPDTNDAYCRSIEGRDQCTYPCASRDECTGPARCIGNPPDNSYCAIVNL